MTRPRRWVVACLSLQLPGLRGLGVGRVAWLAIKDFFADDMATYAAALAFHLLLALFPFIIFLVALLGFLYVPGFFDWLLAQARAALPSAAAGRVSHAVEQVRSQSHGGLLSFGIIGAVWAASTGVRSLMNALNVAYDVAESRPIWQRYLLSIVFTLALAVLVIVATALMLVGPEAVARLAGHAGLKHPVVVAWAWLRIPVALLLLTLAVAAVYDVAPNVDQPFQFLTPGAVLAVLVWLLASLGFSAYVSHIATYSATYGSVAAIIVLLLYFFISSLALLLGAEVNGVIHHHAPRHRAERASPVKRDRRRATVGERHPDEG